MAVRSSGRTPRVRKSKHCNWLEALDKAMKVLPDRLTWSDLAYEGCPCFAITRYPTLIGFPQAFLSPYLSCWEAQIEEGPDTRGVMDGLDNGQRKQLAALVLDTITGLESYNASVRSAGHVHKLASEPWRVRTLNRRLKKAQEALQELCDYARSLDIQDASVVADACLKKLSVLLIGDRTPEFYKSIEAMYPTPEDPVGRGMVQLYWFFRHGCGLTGREAEVRVALIRNAFWEKLGVPKVPLRLKYKVGESRGCDAVHQAVLRF
jgi:hypothetical protein